MTGLHVELVSQEYPKKAVSLGEPGWTRTRLDSNTVLNRNVHCAESERLRLLQESVDKNG